MIDFDDFMTAFVVAVCSILFVCFGIWAAAPDELENGCIMYNDKVYCEEINMEE